MSCLSTVAPPIIPAPSLLTPSRCLTTVAPLRHPGSFFCDVLSPFPTNTTAIAILTAFINPSPACEVHTPCTPGCALPSPLSLSLPCTYGYFCIGPTPGAIKTCRACLSLKYYSPVLTLPCPHSTYSPHFQQRIDHHAPAAPCERPRNHVGNSAIGISYCFPTWACVSPFHRCLFSVHLPNRLFPH
jgi:hypothetical protein